MEQEEKSIEGLGTVILKIELRISEERKVCKEIMTYSGNKKAVPRL
jgi:hypothetical protein